jgi:hypothetical protein
MTIAVTPSGVCSPIGNATPRHHRHPCHEQTDAASPSSVRHFVIVTESGLERCALAVRGVRRFLPTCSDFNNHCDCNKLFRRPSLLCTTDDSFFFNYTYFHLSTVRPGSFRYLQNPERGRTDRKFFLDFC